MPSRASPLPQIFLGTIKKAAVKQRPRKTFIKELQINVRVNRGEQSRCDSMRVRVAKSGKLKGWPAAE
ncbi:hypothetical protein CJU74_10655 [Pseudomonas fragi]|nr:hypothetical protein CJU74_10655 [Pseudomonas fragi]